MSGVHGGWGLGRPGRAPSEGGSRLEAPPSPGNLLFFGCRRRDQDFYWEAEWTELEKRGCLTLVTAFSREQVGVCRGRGGAGRGGAQTHAAHPAGAEGVRAAPAA